MNRYDELKKLTNDEKIQLIIKLERDVKWQKKSIIFWIGLGVVITIALGQFLPIG